MIQARNINKTYGNLQVLKNLDISIEAEEIIAIVGSSGAGKTTLLQILGTLDTPDANPETQLILNGENLIGMKDKQLAQFRNQNIGFVFQFHQLLPEFTALDNIILPGLIGNKNKKELENRALEICTFLHVEHRLHHKPKELSGGEQQRIAIARALINQPKIILADEPSGNLDSKNANELHQLFFDLRKEFKQTFVIVTHNDTLANMCDKKLVMNDGQFI